MRTVTGLFLLMLSSAVLLGSDVVSFKNGDKLTGEWVRINDGKLTFKAETVGEVTISVASMSSFGSSRTAVIMLKGGRVVRGTVSLGSLGDWYVMTESGNRVIPATAVDAIYPQETYEPRNPEHRRPPWENWHGTTILGYSRERGDVQSGSANLGIDATRLQPNLPGLPEHFRTHFNVSVLLANTKPFNGPRISANSASSSLRQDLLFTPSNFVFGLAELDHIQAQSLELRQTYGAGLGRDLIRNSRTRLDFLGGTTWVMERFQAGVNRRNFEGLLGEKFSVKLSPRLRLSEFLNFYPSLTDAGEYRVDMTSTLSAQVASWLSMNTGVTDRYLTRPLAGRMGNDFVVTTGLGVRF